MENCWEAAPQGSQDCYPHYNLFQSSIFYDTDNFRVSYLLEDCIPSESSENEERSAEPPDKPPEAPLKAKRVISKQELYKDPDLFRNDDGFRLRFHQRCARMRCEGCVCHEPIETAKLSEDRQSNTNGPIEPPNPPQPWGYDWTKQSWVKEGAPVVVIPKTPDKRASRPVGPWINNSKAESMMHKMGWEGGALGKAGDGLVEPITAEPIRAFRSSPGSTRPAAAAPGRGPGRAEGGRKPLKRDSFRTNVLLHILEFVQDDTESELLFDVALRQHERRRIMNVVNSVINDEALHALSSAAQYELARDIHAHNKYVLTCGQGDQHQLGIFKEAPEHVYLVTPDDFLVKDDSDVTDDNCVKDDTGVKDDKTGELDDDENPFLKSIKKSIKKDDEPKLTNKFETDCVIAKGNEVKGVENKGESPVPPADKILEFFLEFAETGAYKEMRFLGTFTDSQSSAINALLNDMSLWSLAGGSYTGDELVAKALRAGTFKIKDGPNGTPEIHKVLASTK